MTYFMSLLFHIYPGGKAQALWASMFSIQLGTCFGLLLEALLLIHFSEASTIILLGIATMFGLPFVLYSRKQEAQLRSHNALLSV